MRVFAIADLHLSTVTPKPMTIFGPQWAGHPDAIWHEWRRVVRDQDIVLLPDDPATERQLTEYFPTPLRGTYGEALRAHPLRREIVTTAVANDLVNRGGITFVQRAVEETSATSAQVARAFLVAREIFGLDDYVEQVEALGVPIDELFVGGRPHAPSVSMTLSGLS